MRVVAPAFLRALRELCDEHGLLLMFDEVQTGIGRTGKLFAYRMVGVTPDIMAIAKALGGGFPVGACLATAEAAKGMTAGTHGSTFGGNPLAMAVGNAVLDVVLAPGFLEHVRKISLLFKQRLAEIKDRHPSVIAEVRGEGLLIGLRQSRSPIELREPLRDEKLLTVAAGDNVVRLLPPLIIGEAEIASAMALLERAARDRQAQRRPTEAEARRCPNGRHFLDLTEIPVAELRGMIEQSRAMKERVKRDRATADRPLAGKTLAMIFDKPSTRTRVSFDVAMRQLGGESIMLTGQDMQLGRGETIADTARVLSRYVDAIMIRILDHDALLELARHATVPVINGLTRRSHPCQVMADVMTFEEHRGPIGGRTVAWSGDANNVLASWMHAAERFDFRLRVATPPELTPKKWLARLVRTSGRSDRHRRRSGGGGEGRRLRRHRHLGLDGRQSGERRHNLLKPYQVNARLMAKAKPDAIFMHCLPAHRGEEVTDEVIDGPQSVVFDEAENRLHAQKGILAWCLHAGV